MRHLSYGTSTLEEPKKFARRTEELRHSLRPSSSDNQQLTINHGNGNAWFVWSFWTDWQACGRTSLGEGVESTSTRSQSGPVRPSARESCRHSFSNDAAIQATVQDATYVMSCAGGPHSARKYQKGFMAAFVKEKLWPALQASKPDAFLFQAGALSKRHSFPTFSRLVVAPLLGLGPMANDNDQVMRFIHGNPLESTRVVVTRPGALMQGRGGSKLKASHWPNTMPLAFVDLATFNLEALQDESLAGKCPYVGR